MRISTVVPVLRHPFWKKPVSFFSGDRKASKPSTSKTSKKSTTAPKSHVGGSKLSRHRDEKRKAKKATKSSSSKRPHSPSASKGYPIQLCLQPKVSVWCWNVLVPKGKGIGFNLIKHRYAVLLVSSSSLSWLFWGLDYRSTLANLLPHVTHDFENFTADFEMN